MLRVSILLSTQTGCKCNNQQVLGGFCLCQVFWPSGTPSGTDHSLPVMQRHRCSFQFAYLCEHFSVFLPRWADWLLRCSDCREAAFWRDGLDARNFSPLHQYWWNPLSTSRERVHRQMDQWLVGIFHNISYLGLFPLILYRLDEQPDVACLGIFWLLRVPPFTVCCVCLSTLYLLHIRVRCDGSELGDAEPTWSWIGKRTAHVTRVPGH